MQDQLYITASSGIAHNSIFKNDKIVFQENQAGVSEFLAAAFKTSAIKYPKFYKMDILSKLGWLATEFLLAGSFKQESYNAEDIGIVLSNASSSLDADLRYFDSVKDFASPALFVYTLPNIVIGEISIKHNFKGENAFFIFEKFNADFLVNYVTNLINNDILQACICGWVEVIGDAYNAALFLVEKDKGIAEKELFNKENLIKIYELYNG